MAIQEDIARRLGLSIATVSRSLRSHPAINPETRARVLGTAAEMGYRLNSIETTSGRKDGPIQVGVLIYGGPGVTSEPEALSTRMLKGIAEESRRLNVALNVANVDGFNADKLHDPNVQPEGLRKRRWQGTLLCGHFAPASLAALARRHPCVQVAGYDPELEIDCVDHDDLSSVHKLVAHLWSLGHRRIGLMNYGTGRGGFALTRYAGYQTAMARHAGASSAADVVNVIGSPCEEDGKVTERVATRIKAGVTAWICLTDHAGYRLIQRLAERRIRCPKEVSLCGFDNYEPPAGCPKLTTIDAPFEEMGALALSRLVARIKRTNLQTIHTMLKCRLIEGGSTRKH
jgi:LacI family transcriptional regulator